MGDIASALGIPAELTHRGKVYQLSPWTYKIQGLFERYLEKEAVLTVKRLSPSLTPEMAQEMMARVMQDVAAGVYSFGSEVVARSLKSFPHLKHFLWLLLREKDPAVTPELVQEIMDDQLGEVLSTINGMATDPNSTAPDPGASP